MDQLKTEQYAQLERLAGLYKRMMDSGNGDGAAKMRQLAEKAASKEFTIAFCGHFSAGKSSMINYLLGENLLPSSPIPTSANTVKICKGNDEARLIYRDGKQGVIPAPFDYPALKKFAKDGDRVETILISSERFPLPEGTSVMDTPGIDSTDDAHRVSAESALHLADAVFYMMDYNHVQSEVNFLFTRELLDHGKALYLIVNMIDKHEEEELPFEQFRHSAAEAFAAWNVIPERIFFTSVREQDFPGNEIHELKELVVELAEKGPSDKTVIDSAESLIKKHAEWAAAKYEEAHAEEMEALSELASEERDRLERRAYEIINEKKTLAGLFETAEQSYADKLASVLKNAYLMPAATRELAGRFLESLQPDFKMGLFFSKKKTELEREQRTAAFLAALQETVKAQLDWHIQELAAKTASDAGINEGEIEKAARSISVPVTEELLLQTVKPQVNSSGAFLLNYTESLAEAIKKKASAAAREFLNVLQPAILSLVNKRMDQLGQEGSSAEESKILEMIGSSQEEKAEIYAELTDVLYGRVPADAESLEMLQKRAEQEKEPERVYLEAMEPGLEQPKAMKPPLEIRSKKTDKDRESKKGKDKLQELSQRLNSLADLVQPLKGFQAIRRELSEKAERLGNRTFTVALFGAFSAGKSSFANALLGDVLLPVSPNPTTAAITRILAPTGANGHDTAMVSLKTEQMLFEDAALALAAFDLKPANLEEAYRMASRLIQDERDAGGVHFSFLCAFTEGYPHFRELLGSKLEADHEGFRQFAAEESKSCFVDLIEFYYDCPFTREGMTLVDTPGADSINARHTGAAFEYIKNADAILFVTYYNHPFSKADREFLIQLGRVKDSFAMDKMFFIVNAVDLARDEEELGEVTDYVTSELARFGIRFPKLYPVTSKGAMKEAKEGKFLHSFLRDSGMPAFQDEFHAFIEEDLTELAAESAKAAILRTRTQLTEVLAASRQNEAAKAGMLKTLAAEEASGNAVIERISMDMEKERLQKEIDELLLYTNQRVFYRFGDFFKESFNPSVIKEGADLKKVLSHSANDLIKALGFDLSQEMRAASLRLEQFVQKLLAEKQAKLLEILRETRPSLSLQEFEPEHAPNMDFPQAFADLSGKDLKKELSLFKNPKSFFEKNDKTKMREAISKFMEPPAAVYSNEQNRRLYSEYAGWMEYEAERLKKASAAQISNRYAALRAAAEEKLDTAYVESVMEEAERMAD